GGYFENTSLLLLHSTGAKSGQTRVNPLASLINGDRYVVIASKGGAPTHPDWYYNVVANSVVQVELGTETFEATATVANEPERTDLYQEMIKLNAGFASYLDKTTRVIPVVILTRN
ncbi:MAG: nitroreductase family deazaflavin-dependent oxidoreductase, partial [Chloroflexota bacterium]